MFILITPPVALDDQNKPTVLHGEIRILFPEVKNTIAQASHYVP